MNRSVIYKVMHIDTSHTELSSGPIFILELKQLCRKCVSTFCLKNMLLIRDVKGLNSAARLLIFPSETLLPALFGLQLTLHCLLSR